MPMLDADGQPAQISLVTRYGKEACTLFQIGEGRNSGKALVLRRRACKPAWFPNTRLVDWPSFFLRELTLNPTTLERNS
jgi:hypothetical protein